MEGNRIKGRVPAAFGNLSSLLLLHLGSNQLTGEVPVELARSDTLQVLILDNNRLNGSIPPELGAMKGLGVLNLQQNALTGPIPSTLANISGLQLLMLGANALSSSIPRTLGSLTGLIGLNLSSNMLDGSLPVEMEKLTAMNTIDLSANRLSGNIPSSLGEMQMMVYLDLSNNLFQGQIPESFSKFINIGYVNLSHNRLSGTIPEALAGLRDLTSLDLSFNMLEGQVPRGRVFSNSTAAILQGNSALCGAPGLNFPPCAATDNASHSGTQHLLEYILPAIAAAVILLVGFYVAFRRCRRGQAKIPAQTDTLFSSNYRLISYHELVRVTDNFNEANLLGKGSFGSVYKACLDDGLVTAVKILNLDVEGASKSFDVECSALSMLRHRNLVKVITTCSNLDFKALILQFMPNGSLEKWLHSEDLHLNLLQRINVIVDVSLALEYLHHHHHHVVVHSDIKPSNVLFDENMTAYVSDFGIAKLLLDGGKSVASASTAGTIGYIAPEYGSTGNVTRRSDVYSFGILILEMFTGKKPTDAEFTGESGLRQ